MKSADLSPEAKQAAKEELRDKLIAEQSVIGAVVGGIIGAIPGFALYLTLLYGGVHPIILFFVPGIFVGYGVRFLGRGILPIYGRVAGLIVAVCLAAVGWYFGLSALAFGLAIPNILIAVLIAPRNLSREEGGAVYDYRIGRWQP